MLRGERRNENWIEGARLGNICLHHERQGDIHGMPRRVAILIVQYESLIDGMHPSQWPSLKFGSKDGLFFLVEKRRVEHGSCRLAGVDVPPFRCWWRGSRQRVA